MTGSEAIFTSQGVSVLAASPTLSEQALFIEPARFFTTFRKFLSPNNHPFVGGTLTDDSLQFSLSIRANAFGIRLIDEALALTETIEVFGASGLLHTETGGLIYYFGIITDEANTQIIINEASGDGDDIGFDNLHIGLWEGFTIRAPSVGVLFLLGLGFVLRLTRPALFGNNFLGWRPASHRDLTPRM